MAEYCYRAEVNRETIWEHYTLRPNFKRFASAPLLVEDERWVFCGWIKTCPAVYFGNGWSTKCKIESTNQAQFIDSIFERKFGLDAVKYTLFSDSIERK